MAQPRQAGGGSGEARAGGGLLSVRAGTDPQPDPGTDLGKGPTCGPSPRRKPIEEQLQRAKTKLARESRADVIGAHIGAGSKLREAWAELALTRQKAIVSALVDHLVVRPGKRGLNRFDPNRVEPVWRA